MDTSGLEISLLLEFYGDLLTERQRELVGYYYNDDFSLAEISEITGITRQGVRESIKKSEASLRLYEQKLHVYSQYLKRQKDADTILSATEALADLHGISKKDDNYSAIIKAVESVRQ